jgi:hypothetical protein
MNTTRKGRLVPEDTAAEAVARYLKGDRVNSIASDLGIPRSTLYWILEKNGVAPSRAQRKVRFSTDGETVEALYALILEQEEYISSLEEEVASLRVRLKDMRSVSKKLS